MRRLALPAIFTARKTGFSIKAGLVSFTLILTAICGVAGYFKADLLRDEFHRIAIAQGFTPGLLKLQAAITPINRILPRSPIR